MPQTSTSTSVAASGLAVVIGSSGGLGAALLARLKQDNAYARVMGLSRTANPSEVSIDYLDEASIAAAAQTVADLCATARLQLRLLIDFKGQKLPF